MKAILVFDMPDKCQNCPCFCHLIPKCQADFGREMGEAMCRIGRPDWCPLKPMPMKMRTDEGDIEEDSYWQGWNDCIEEIEK